jgi:hypothetical protein
MSVFASQWNAGGELAQQRRAATLGRIAALRELGAAGGSGIAALQAAV